MLNLFSDKIFWHISDFKISYLHILACHSALTKENLIIYFLILSYVLFVIQTFNNFIIWIFDVKSFTFIFYYMKIECQTISEYKWIELYIEFVLTEYTEYNYGN